MLGDSKVVFTRGDPDSEDIWDDSLLIAAYSKATTSSQNKIQRDWRLGENVRCEYEGDEYEAVIQALDSSKSEATIRYVGYNNVERVPIRNLKSSLGQAERDRQILEAQENESECVHSSSSSWNVGDNCIMVYRVDQKPYEAIITRIEGDFAEVKFLGYDNVQQNNSLSELTPSAGSESQSRQIEAALREKLSAGLKLDTGVIIPPPPPPLNLGANQQETVALNSLLISWYQAGYHAGYLDALRKS